MTIVVTYAPRDADPVVVELPDERGPFEVLKHIERRMFGDRPVSTAPAAASKPPSSPSRVTESPPRAAGVRDTSVSAYRTLAHSGELTKQQRQILQVIVSGAQRDWTRKEISEASGLPINCVCGRVNEMLNGPFGLLEEFAPRKCSVTKQTANPVRVVQEDVVVRIVASKEKPRRKPNEA